MQSLWHMVAFPPPLYFNYNSWNLTLESEAVLNASTILESCGRKLFPPALTYPHRYYPAFPGAPALKFSWLSAGEMFLVAKEQVQFHNSPGNTKGPWHEETERWSHMPQSQVRILGVAIWQSRSTWKYNIIFVNNKGFHSTHYKNKTPLAVLAGEDT